MNKLSALILCGGESSRMGTDKGLLEYYGKPQREYLYDMASPLCREVFIACNAKQAASVPGTFSVLADSAQYAGIGPMAALLTAFSLYPESNFLVLGCDYPFLNLTDIRQLIDAQQEESSALGFFNPETGFAEPLLAIYKATSFKPLLEQYTRGNYSLRRFLKSIRALKLIPSSLESLCSIDSFEAHQQVLVKLKSGEDLNPYGLKSKLLPKP